MPSKKKPEPVMVDGIPIRPISPAEHRRLDRRIKKKHEKLRRRYPEVPEATGSFGLGRSRPRENQRADHDQYDSDQEAHPS
jgi:hypothetical protein